MHAVARHRVVVREAVAVVEAEHREERLVEFLLVHAAKREDRTLAPLGEAGRGAREVRIVRLQHRDRHSEDRGDLLDDLLAPAQILRREVERREGDVAGDGQEVAVLPRTSQALLDLPLEPIQLVGGRRALDRHRVVGSRGVPEHCEVHLVQRDVRLDDSPRRLDLAKAIVEVARIRSAEVDHLVGREDLPVLRVDAVDVALDERLIARDDLDVLRAERPEFRGQAGRRVDDRVEVRVAGQFAIQDAEDREVEAVEERVGRREDLEDRVRVDDLLHLVAVRGRSTQDRHRRPLVAGGVAE